MSGKFGRQRAHDMHDRAPQPSAMLKKGGGWKCEHGARCLVACPGCPFVHRPPVTSICKMCVGSGYISIRNGDDIMDCPACAGTGKR